MNFGSLFAGVGGFDCGMERAGMECRWQVEINPFRRKVLATHWPEVKRYEDIKECGSRQPRTRRLHHRRRPLPRLVGRWPTCRNLRKTLWPLFRVCKNPAGASTRLVCLRECSRTFQ